MNQIALSAAESIVDGNSDSLNIEETVPGGATSVSLRAGTGMIGGAGGTTSATNAQALDLNVDTVAASSATGVYLRELAAGGAIEVNTAASVSIDIDGVVRSDFDSGTTDVSEDRMLSSLADLTTGSNGAIKLVAESGTITVNGGGDATGVSADGTGDVLLESRTGGTAGSDVVINAGVLSGTGHITLNAADDVDVNAVLTTGGSGTVYINAGDDEATGINGIALDAVVTTVDGDVLLTSADDISQTALITSTNGDIGLIASDTITQTATGDITTTDGDVLVDAGGHWTMDGAAEITAGGQDVLGQSGGTITLGVIRVTDAAMNQIALSAAESIVDGNSDSLNIEETDPGAATSVSLRAGTGMIGGAGGTTSATNAQALDLNVDTVAASSATGVYLRELAAGGAIEVNTAASVSIDIDGVVRSDFDSGTTDVSEDRMLSSLADLTTGSNGAIKLVAESGTITVNGGGDATGVSADGTGDVLLESRTGGTAGSDVVINAGVLSGTGHITLNAADDVDVNAVLTTGGSGTVYINAGDDEATGINGIALDAVVTTVDGDVLLTSADDISQTALITSTNGDIGLIASDTITQTATGDITTTDGDVLVDAGGHWTMDGAAEITAGGQDVLGQSGGTITLGVIRVTDAAMNQIALSAAESIVDGNSDSLNIEETDPGAATSVSLRAGTGMIGGAGGTTSATNAQALDLNVDTVAASSATGVYLRELAAGGAIEVNTAASVSIDIDGVVRSDFDSGTTDVSEDRMLSSLADLTTGSNGAIKLVAESGTITVNGGGDATGVSADGTGDVLLESRTGGTAGSDVVINAGVLSGTGHITLNAADDVDVNAVLTTGGSGTVYINAGDDEATGINGIALDAVVTTVDGDVLLTSADDISQTALITSTNGDIGLIASDTITQTATGDITTTDGDVLVDAGGHWTMDGAAEITAGGQDVLGQSGGTITLGVIRVTDAAMNQIALSAAESIVDGNSDSLNIEETVPGAATSVSLRAGTGMIGGAGGTTSATNAQALDLNVDTVAASSATGVYLRELAAGGAIEVNTAASVSIDIDGVVRSDFDSGTTDVSEDRMLSSLADLTTGSNGAIKLVAESGTITVNGGGDATGVSADGTGDVLLESRTGGTAGSDVIDERGRAFGDGPYYAERGE